jgi:hypothetical protein
MSQSDDMASLKHLEGDPEIQDRSSRLARALFLGELMCMASV